MKKVLFSLVALTVATSASAALSPYNQRLVEIQGILEAPGLEELILDPKATSSSGLVDAVGFVRETKKGAQYKVVSGTCTLDVVVEYLPPANPVIVGPQEFKVVLGEKLNCRRLRP